MKLKEKDIVNYLCESWTDFFPEMIGCKKEFSFRNSRVDILSAYPVDLFELGIREEDSIYRNTNAAVFCEVKFNNNHRDLLFELQKLVNFRKWYIEQGKSFCYIMVISDDYDADMVKFIKENQIMMYKYSIEDEDLNTFEIEEYLGG